MVSIKSDSPRLPALAPPGPQPGNGRFQLLRRWLGNAMVQRVLSVIVVLAAWQLVGVHFPYSMSAPTAIARGARSSLVSQVLPAFGQTLASFGIGFAISIAVGVPVGLVMARIRVIRLALEPCVLMLYSLPMLALIPSSSSSSGCPSRCGSRESCCSASSPSS
jgi:ABC-type Fe3+ transport system permease subunit